MKEAGGPGRERMKRNRILTNKYLLLVAVLIAMLALSGCRTRITNNSEVSNVKYDEDGFLSETYQMRRDELGLSIAERPLLPDLGSPEEDENSEPEIDENLNVVPEEDTYVEPPTTTEARNNANNNTNTNTRRTSSPSTPRDTPTTTYEITFNPGEGQLEGKPKGSYVVKRIPEDTEVIPPGAKRDGYTLSSWKNSDGSIIVKPGDAFKVTKKDVFTAQWTKNGGETPKPEKFTVVFTDEKGNELSKQYIEKGKSATAPSVTPREGFELSWSKDFSNVQSDMIVIAIWTDVFRITFDGNGGPGASEQKGKIGDEIELPSPNAIKDGYTFGGWSKSKDGSDPLPAGSKYEISGNDIFYAKWDPNEEDYKYWDEQFEKAPKPSVKPKCYVTGGTNDGVPLVAASNAELKDNVEESLYVIVYSADGSDVETIKSTYSDSEKSLLILPEIAYSDDKYKTVYKTLILKWLKEDTALDYNVIARKLKLIGEEDEIKPYYDSKAGI